MPIRIKRVYEKYEDTDGFRVLVDRLWPRGISKEKGRIDLWLKEAAPSDELRKSYRADSIEWGDFRDAYLQELEDLEERLPEIRELAERAAGSTITFVYSSKNTR